MLYWVGSDPAQDLRAERISVFFITCEPVRDSQGDKVLMSIHLPEENQINWAIRRTQIISDTVSVP